MRIIREHTGENPDRICHVVEMSHASDRAQATILSGIDEDFLSWFYIAPGCEVNDTERQLLDLARQLIGADAWAIVQVSAIQNREVVERLGLKVVESYQNIAHDPSKLDVYLARTV